MFSELKSLEYTVEIIKAMAHAQGVQGSKEIHRLVVVRGVVDPALSYFQKLLPKLVRAGILKSSDSGYELVKPADEITVSSVLDVCDMPPKQSLIYTLCFAIKDAFSLTTVYELFGDQ